jgi:peptide/nickel transport system substrate-binding protein
VFPPSMFTYSGNLPGYPVDNLAKAKALVKQLGGLSFTMNIDDTPGWLAEAEALQAQLAQAGIKVTINSLQTPAWIGSLHALTYEGLLIVSPPLTDPDEIADRWFLSGSAQSQNGLSNPQADQLIGSGRTNYSQAARLPVYKKLNQLLGAQLLPWDDLFGQPFYQVFSKSVSGWPLYTSSYVPWNTISLSK